MADVKIKLTLDGAENVKSGLQGVSKDALQASDSLENVDKASHEASKSLNNAGEASDSFGSKLTSGLTNGLVVAGKAIAGFSAAAAGLGTILGTNVLKSVSAYEQAVGGIDTLFQASSAKMQAYAAEAYATAGVSATEYMSQVTSFSATLLASVGGDTERAADLANQAMILMSDNANKLGTDMTSIQNAFQGFAKTNFGMLDNLKLGYGGTAEEMARLLNDSGVLENGLVATASNINEIGFDKYIEAIQVIQDRLKITGTTALEAHTTLAGSLAMTKGAWEDLLVAIGTGSEDVDKKLDKFVSSATTLLGNVAPVIENMGTSIAAAAPAIAEGISSVIPVIARLIPALVKTGVDLIVGLTTGVVQAIPELVSTLAGLVPGMVDTIVEAVPALIDAGAKAVTALLEGLSQSLPSLIDGAISIIGHLINGLLTNLPSLVESGLQLITALAQGLLEGLPKLIGMLPTIIEKLNAALTEAIPLIIETGVALLTSIVKDLPAIIKGIVEVLPVLINTIVQNIATFTPVIVDAGIELFTALVEATPEIVAALIEILPILVDALISYLGTMYPAMAEAGFKLIVALVQHLPAIIGNVVGAVVQLIGAVLSTVGGKVSEMAQRGMEFFQSLVGRLPEAISFIVSRIPQVVASIASAISTGVGSMWRAGEDLVRGIWRGIQGMGGWLWRQVSGFMSGLVSNVKSFFGIASPSKLFRDEIGKWLPAGIGVGVTLNSDSAIKPIDDLIKDVSVKAHTLVSLTQPKTTNTISSAYTPQTVPIRFTQTLSRQVSSSASTPVISKTPTTTIPEEVTLVDSKGELIARLKTEITKMFNADGNSYSILGV